MEEARIQEGKKGSILSILATYVDSGSPYVIPSATAKSGLQAFTRSIAAECYQYFLF